MAALCDTIGRDYRTHRRPDPRIAAAIVAALGPAATVVGSCESADRRVIAVEPLARVARRAVNPDIFMR